MFELHSQGSRAVARSRVDARLVTLLSIELLDELLFGALDASWPLIRDELGLGYAEIGMLVAFPRLVSVLLDPPTALLLDTSARRATALCGGVLLAVALAMMAASAGFTSFLIAVTLAAVASGAFVGTAQAALVERDLEKAESAMAKWALAGSVGMLAGPVLVATLVSIGLGWRAALAVGCGATLVGVAGAWRVPIEAPGSHDGIALGASARSALAMLRDRRVVRWLVLLQVSDLMVDVLHGLLALYFVDVVAASERTAALALAVWTGVGLLGDALLLVVLRHVDGLRYLRASAAVTLLLYTAFLLVDGFAAKLVLAGALGIANAGWYSILQARLYREAPGRAGAVLALDSVSSSAGALVPLALGALAAAAGLGPAMWMLVAGPLGLLFGIPGRVATSDVKNSATLPIPTCESGLTDHPTDHRTRNEPRSPQ